MRKYLLIALLVSICQGSIHAQACYDRFMQEGITLYDSLDYEEAITRFDAAIICSDKPDNREAEAWLDKAKKARVSELTNRNKELELQKDSTQLALLDATKSLLASRSMISLSNGDPIGAMRLADSLYAIDSAELSIPMIKAYYSDIYEYETRDSLYAVPFSQDIYINDTLDLSDIWYVSGSDFFVWIKTSQNRLIKVNEEHARTYPLNKRIQTIHVDKAGKYFGFINNNDEVIWGEVDGKDTLRKKFSHSVQKIDFEILGDKTYLICVDIYGSMQLYEADSGSSLWKEAVHFRQQIENLSISSSRTYIAVVSKKGYNISIFKNRANGKYNKFIELNASFPVRHLQFKNNHLIAVTNQDIQLFNVENGKKEHSFILPYRLSVSAISMHYSGNYIVVGFIDGTIHLYKIGSNNSMNNNKLVTRLLGHKGKILSLNFSHNGNYIFSSSQDGNVKLWRLKGKSIPYWPDNTLLPDSLMRIEKYLSTKNTIDFNKVVIASQDPDKREYMLKGHADLINDLDFTQDGKFIITGSNDKSLKIWNNHAELLHTFNFIQKIQKCYFTKMIS